MNEIKKIFSPIPHWFFVIFIVIILISMLLLLFKQLIDKRRPITNVQIFLTKYGVYELKGEDAISKKMVAIVIDRDCPKEDRDMANAFLSLCKTTNVKMSDCIKASKYLSYESGGIESEPIFFWEKNISNN